MINRSNLSRLQLGGAHVPHDDHVPGLPPSVVNRGSTGRRVVLPMTVAPSSRHGVWHRAWPEGRRVGAHDAFIPLGRGPVHIARSIVADELEKLPLPIQPHDIPSWTRSWQRALEEIRQYAHELGYDTVLVLTAGHPDFYLVITGQQFQCPACPRGYCT